DCYHIKKIDKSIEKSILTYPDDIKVEELMAFHTYKLKIINHIHYSAIDDVVGQRELYELIQAYAIKDLSVGKRKDLIGNDFESSIANILNNRENFEKWTTGDEVKVGVQYHYFEKIVNFFGLKKNEVIGIEATSDKNVIGSLESSGMPKTDVIVYVYYNDSERDVRHFTISCKKTNEKAVSVHQYIAEAFVDVLNSEDRNLKVLLREFQKYGNLRDFGEENKELLTMALKPYMRKLVRWVLGGFGGKNKTELQLANYILISDDKDIFIHTIDEYTEELLKPENIVHFGTPFSWTYASGRKGKDIQLKCKIIK
nr:MspI family type II restriction endonuclease [Treponema sp.]